MIQVVHPLCRCRPQGILRNSSSVHMVWIGSGQGELSSIISWIIIGSSIRCIACYYLHPKSPPFCMGICFLPIRLFVYLRVVSSLAPSRSSYGSSYTFSLSGASRFVLYWCFGLSMCSFHLLGFSPYYRLPSLE